MEHGKNLVFPGPKSTGRRVEDTVQVCSRPIKATERIATELAIFVFLGKNDDYQSLKKERYKSEYRRENATM